MHAGDTIIIRGLDIPVHIGVPDAERAVLQTVNADIQLVLRGRFEKMADEIQNTVDYEAVARSVRALAVSRPRKLLETLAADMAESLLQNDGLASVGIELRKRILPGVDHVAVRLTRDRS